MRSSPIFATTLLMLASAGSALANDSTASFATGGLVLTKTADIAMRSEDLSVSTEAIRVAYVFQNTSDKPVTTTVAFPVPAIPASPFGDIAIPSDDPENPLGFETRVDGKSVAMKLDQKATLNGRDVTALLTGLGVPLAPQDPKAGEALDALPKNKQDELVAAEIAAVDEFDAGGGWERHIVPLWTWSGTYHWEQTFEPGRDLRVEHSYAPSVGGSVATLLEMAADYPDEVKAMRATYCIDDAFMSALDKRSAEARKADPDYGYAFSEQNFEYVLTTGANWSEPIGDFKLTVDKGAPENLVSFCADGVTKVSPTRFEVRHENFTPKSDLAVLILVPVAAPQP
ncbi:DUF4424 domain-containing protein [Antarcticirhabdus aurantiaca]|uniref:DUF4424 domain-containing protein n=1 Tax=Antarcticirhabdus aurantiaca TaxID=2606717 RepID=A0ACD4NTT7_9HYPH|nr:DUF4424 domain-containing protein [Antarcticirhabdus aurantiaca]WAJ30262.1 DUF4424 domain-containing protein [Jeongeuplla avenae]